MVILTRVFSRDSGFKSTARRFEDINARCVLWDEK